MKHNAFQHLPWLALLILVLATISVPSPQPIQAEAQVVMTASARVHRMILPNEWQVSYPAGIAYSAPHNRFFLLDKRSANPAGANHARIVTLTPDEQSLGAVALTFRPDDASNLVFDERGDRLLLLNLTTQQLMAIGLDANALPDINSLTRMDVTPLGLQRPLGLAVDTASQHLYVLDAPSSQAGGGWKLVKMELPASFPVAETVRFEKLLLPATISDGGLRGLALDPETHHLFVLNHSQQRLYELTANLQVVGQIDTSALSLVDPQGWVAAYTPDLTDDPKQVHLFVADSNLANTFTPTASQWYGRIVELAWEPIALNVSAASTEAINLTLVRTTNTSAYSSPSPDPAGIDYLTDRNLLLIGDSEVDEMPALFTGSNLFATTRSGSLSLTDSTLPFSNEPTGIAYNPANRHYFTADDDQDKVYEIAPGADGVLLTGDDTVTSFATGGFGATDAEGLAFDTSARVLFLIDGMNAEIYRISPGANGIFNGIPPTGDDVVTHFDTLALGISDPEGIAFDARTNHLVVAGEPTDRLFELTTSGTVVQQLTYGGVSVIVPAGVAIAPHSSIAGATSYYVVDRGVDNDQNPNENDGKLFEFSSTTPSGNTLYLSSGSGGTVGGVTFSDEDILTFNTGSNTWSLYFDGSDVGLSSNDVDGFERMTDGSLLVSLDITQTISPLGQVEPTDILKFTPTSLGATTAGSFAWFLDGSDVGLNDTEAEDIDAVGLLPDGRLTVSTRGSFSVPSLTGLDEDLIALNNGVFGQTSSGSWVRYFDGSDVGLDASTEDTRSIEVAANAKIYLSVSGAFSVPGASGDDSDVILCTASSVGETTACTYQLFFDGETNGFGSEDIDCFDLSTATAFLESDIPITTTDDRAEEAGTGVDPSDDGNEEREREEEEEVQAVQQIFLPLVTQ